MYKYIRHRYLQLVFQSDRMIRADITQNCYHNHHKSLNKLWTVWFLLYIIIFIEKIKNKTKKDFWPFLLKKQIKKNLKTTFAALEKSSISYYTHNRIILHYIFSRSSWFAHADKYCSLFTYLLSIITYKLYHNTEIVTKVRIKILSKQSQQKIADEQLIKVGGKCNRTNIQNLVVNATGQTFKIWWWMQPGKHSTVGGECNGQTNKHSKVGMQPQPRVNKSVRYSCRWIQATGMVGRECNRWNRIMTKQ